MCGGKTSTLRGTVGRCEAAECRVLQSDVSDRSFSASFDLQLSVLLTDRKQGPHGSTRDILSGSLQHILVMFHTLFKVEKDFSLLRCRKSFTAGMLDSQKWYSTESQFLEQGH